MVIPPTGGAADGAGAAASGHAGGMGEAPEGGGAEALDTSMGGELRVPGLDGGQVTRGASPRTPPPQGLGRALGAIRFLPQHLGCG